MTALWMCASAALRAALGSAGTQIKTVYKTGYRLEEA